MKQGFCRLRYVMLLTTIFAGTWCSGSVIRVPSDFPTIQEGIDASINGDIIMIADGIFSGENNTDVDFLGKSITVMSENGPENCVIMIQSSGSRGFRFHSGENHSSILQGIKILYGSNDEGGAVLCESSSPLIQGCIFVGNTSDLHGGGISLHFSDARVEECVFTGNSALEYGGAVYCQNSNIHISDCIFSWNSAYYGGAVNGIDSTIVIESAHFTGNSGLAAGGCYVFGSLVMVDCDFQGNTATGDHAGGGGLYISELSRASIENCRFSGNVAGQGGAIFLSADMESDFSLVSGCYVSGNYAESGGGIFCSFTNLVLSNTEINGNHARMGSGLCVAGPIQVFNCLLTDNEATEMGGAVNSWSDPDPEFANCTFSGNEAPLGSAIYFSQCGPAIANSIIWNNSSDPIHPESGETIHITHSDIQGNFSGSGNIDLDPLFVSSGLCNFFLSQLSSGQTEDSPCIDLGNSLASTICFDTPAGQMCLDEMTTRTDAVDDLGLADLGYHYMVSSVPPTPTPTNTIIPTNTPIESPTPTPTGTPVIPDLGIDLVLSGTLFRAGDTFHLEALISNPGPDNYCNLPLFVILDVHGSYFYYPEWSMDLDYNMIDLQAGIQRKQILLFEWPEIDGDHTGIFFHAALLTDSFNAILGRWSSVEFGWTAS